MRILTFILLLATTPLFAGTITTGSTSLYAFGNVYPFHSSTTQYYTVSGTGLTANLVITADSGFEVSTTYGSGFSKSVTLIPSSGSVATTTVFVRFSPAVTGSFSGSVVNSSTGSTTKNITVSGTCIAWAIPTSPSNYYSTATGTGATLKTNLSTKISGHTAVGYTPGVWNAFYTTDVQPNGKVWDVYSTSLTTTPPYEYTLGTDQDNGTLGGSEGDWYNREHTFPQSWFGGTVPPMHSDVHHILATDKKVNNLRSNYPYGTVSSPTTTTLIGGKLGPNTSTGFTGTVFEPVDEYKGDIARGKLYMITRYETSIVSWQTNGNADDVLSGNTFPGYDTWYVDLLLAWHNQDPVSDKEIKRNNAIYALQNNRNPYIDSPQFVQRIWGGSIPAEPSVSSSDLIITNNNNTSVTLNWKSGNGNRRVVLVKAGSAVSSFPTDTFQYSANTNITLAPQIGNGNYVVYNGTGSTVTLSNLTQGTTYYYAVVEYNGWYTTANYQSTGVLTGGGATLPVEFLSFTAELATDTEVLLKWTTASENNNDYFAIERSTDNTNWDSIASVPGAGTSHRVHNYQYLDTPPANQSTVYYRLKQTDFDGNFSYSQTVSVVLNTTGLGFVDPPLLTITPNPFHNQFTITTDGRVSKDLTLCIQNLLGETIVERLIPNNNEKINYTVTDIDDLPAGIYFVYLKHPQNSRITKLIKQ